MQEAIHELVRREDEGPETGSPRLWSILEPWIGRRIPPPHEGVLDDLEILRRRWYGANLGAFLVWKEIRANDLDRVRCNYYTVSAAYVPLLYLVRADGHDICAHFFRVFRIMAEEGYLDPEARGAMEEMTRRVQRPLTAGEREDWDGVRAAEWEEDEETFLSPTFPFSS